MGIGKNLRKATTYDINISFSYISGIQYVLQQAFKVMFFAVTGR